MLKPINSLSCTVMNANSRGQHIDLPSHSVKHKRLYKLPLDSKENVKRHLLKATLLEWFHRHKYAADPMGDRVCSLEMGVGSCLQLRPKSWVPGMSPVPQKHYKKHNTTLKNTRTWSWEALVPSSTSSPLFSCWVGKCIVVRRGDGEGGVGGLQKTSVEFDTEWE